ncbi:MAG: branched-chain amino acid ABC transporter substrate-binding protein [Hyphomicrobiaceae bacterium]
MADDPIRIAVVGPVTGAARLTTRAIEAGARRAIGELSATGSQRFTLITEDDGCDPQTATTKAHGLIAAGVDLVLGHPCTKAAIAAAEVYAQSSVVFIATHTRHPALTANGRRASIFRLCGRDDGQGRDAARILLGLSGDKPIAIVNDRTLYAKTIAEAAERVVRAAKAQMITATVIAGQKEYPRLVSKIKDASIVFYAGFPLEAGFITSELLSAGSGARIIASDAVATRELPASFPQITSKIDVLMRADDETDETLARAAVEIFTHAYVRAYGPVRDQWMSDAATRSALAAGILAKAGPHASTSGPIAFDAAGDADVTSYKLMQWDGKNWVPARRSF